MSPELQAGEWIFTTIESAAYGDFAHLKPIVTVQESEGLTLIISQEEAVKNHITFDSSYKMITLQIHSSLEAVGLTAAFATKLGEHGISANVIAGFFHDHIFVQASKAEEAVEALKELQS